jgi:hypothetical protein
MTTTGTFSFTTAHWMIHRVHGDASNMRPFTEPASTASFTEFPALIFPVANLTDAGTTKIIKFSYFTRRQPDEYIFTLFSH